MKQKISACIKSELVTSIFAKMIHTGKMPGWMEKRLNNKKSEEMEYYQKLIGSFGIDIYVPGIPVHVFYATRMGNQYLERYQKHFKNPHMIPFHLNHEELFLCYAEEWVKQIQQIVRLLEEIPEVFWFIVTKQFV